MIAIIDASLFSIVIILSILLICGLPLGELTMGGQYKVFPKKLRIVFDDLSTEQTDLCISMYNLLNCKAVLQSYL